MEDFEPELLATIQQSLQLHLHENATFLAERLYANAPSESTMHVLATCLFSSGAKVRAYHLLQSCVEPHNRYLLALCCLELDHLLEAERALLGSSQPGGAEAAIASPASVPNGAAGLYVLGLVCAKSQRREQAARYFTLSLELNPYMWSAYEGLCQLGVEPPPLASLLAARADGASAAHAASALRPAGGGGEASAACAPSRCGGGVPATPAQFSPFGAFTPAHSPLGGGAQAGDWSGPGLSGLGPAAGGLGLVAPGSGLQMRGLSPAGSEAQWGLPSPLASATPQSESPGSAMAAPLRRRAAPASARPLASALGAEGARPGLALGLPGSAVPASLAEGSGQRQGRGAPRTAAGGAAGSSARGQALPSAQPQFGAEAASAGDAAPPGPGARLLHALALALSLVGRFECAQALRLLQTLPARQLRTGWALCLVGRAHFEAVSYVEAERAFAQALAVEPQRLAGHELHSTLLWHLRAEVKLCHLAQHALAVDRRDPVTWLVLGNCFSQQQEHETALRFLQRAVQLQPSLVYAHTLRAHEFAALEDFDKALAAYRQAILLDERHYNAWYGMGSVFFRQERFELAQVHLARALELHPRSSPLQCYLGMALHEKALVEGQRPEAALLALERAVALDSHNSLAHFQRARVLVSLGRPQEALDELSALREFAPKEGAVHLLLGRLHKRLGQPAQALACLSTALDLHPKDSQAIKAAIHTLQTADDDDVNDGP